MNRRTFLSLPLPLVLAHDWYEPSCCSGQDCEELEDHEVRVIKEGYSVDYFNYAGYRVQTVVAFDSAKPSRDGRYHGCSIGMSLLCLYVPQNV